MFQQHHDRDWEYNEFDPREHWSSRRDKRTHLIKLRQMDWWKQYGTQHYHQANFGGLIGVWKITPSREFDQHQCQWLGESWNHSYHHGAKYRDRLYSWLRKKQHTAAHVLKTSCDSRLRLIGASFLRTYALFLQKLAAKVISVLWISSHLKFSPWEFSSMPWFHRSWTEKHCSVPICIARQRRSFMNSDRVLIFLTEVNESSSTMCIGCPTSSVAQTNLTIKINFNILHSFSSFILTIFTIYMYAFLQSLHPSIREKLCSRSPAGFLPEWPEYEQELQMEFWCDISSAFLWCSQKGQKEEVRGCQIWRIGGWGVCFIRLRPM
jgi:hypothetical protein